MRIHRKHLKVVTERDAKLAWLLVNGHPGVEAARLVGYSPSYSKKIGRILKTWGVREAMTAEIERRRAEWRQPPVLRRPKYARRPIVKAYERAQIEAVAPRKVALTKPCPNCRRQVREQDIRLDPTQRFYCCSHCG